jgi:peroxiredoxin Q/BCP
MSIQVGDKIPSFTLLNQNNQEVDINSFVGTKNIVIYFYPKDNTPGCTKEACSFRDAMQNLNNLDCEIIGISADSVSSHKAFATQYNLKFNLLSDTNNQIRKLFGVPRNLFGIIPGRVSYICDKEGIVLHIVNSQMNPDKHIQETIETLEAITK